MNKIKIMKAIIIARIVVQKKKKKMMVMYLKNLFQ